MKEHHYSTTIEWTGNNGSGTSSYKAYSRDHDFTAGDKPSIKLSSDPAFMGDPKRHNPEELLVASLSSCHMLWYLHLCSVNKITVTKYQDNASGQMEESKDGSGRFTGVQLNPEVTIMEAEKQELAASLHHKANEMCFIANSCNFPINHQCIIKVE